MNKREATHTSGSIGNNEDIVALLSACGHFHDWFLIEVRSVADIQFLERGVTYPGEGRAVGLRVADGLSEVSFFFTGVVLLQLRSGPDAIQESAGHVSGNGEISLRFDDMEITALKATWSKGAYSAALAFGPALASPGTPVAAKLGEGWVQCPSCREAWQNRWAVEYCPSCRTVVSCPG